MEMKINFNKLFEFDDSNSHTPSTTSLQNSYRNDEPSILSNPSTNINIQFKFNEALFFDSSSIQENQQNLNILGDLSSIGRQFEDSFEKDIKQKPFAWKHNTKPTQKQQKFQQKSRQTDCTHQNQQSAPTAGQRLYYQSKIQNQRKMREYQRIKQEIEQQQSKQITFKPAINQKSKKILEMAESPLRKLNNIKKIQENREKTKEEKSHAKLKEQQELKNCTFRPKIIKTQNSKFISSALNSQRDLNKVFDQLYNDHKVKEKRRQMALKQLGKRQKKMSQEQLKEFFQRNQEYIQEKKHRQELLKAVSSQYDLTSGRKLFQPKINVMSATIYNSKSSAALNYTPSSKRISFERGEEGLYSSASLANIKSLNSKSGKSNQSNHSNPSYKSKSRSEKQHSQASIKQFSLKQNKSQKKFQDKNNKTIKTVEKDKDKNKNRGKQLKKTSKSQHKPLPYQVSKVIQSSHDKNGHKLQNIQKKQERSNNKQYNKPKSSIFTKIQVESLLEEKQQQSQRSFRVKEKNHQNSIQYDEEIKPKMDDQENKIDSKSNEDLLMNHQQFDFVASLWTKNHYEEQQDFELVPQSDYLQTKNHNEIQSLSSQQKQGNEIKDPVEDISSEQGQDDTEFENQMSDKSHQYQVVDDAGQDEVDSDENQYQDESKEENLPQKYQQEAKNEQDNIQIQIQKQQNDQQSNLENMQFEQVNAIEIKNHSQDEEQSSHGFETHQQQKESELLQANSQLIDSSGKEHIHSQQYNDLLTLEKESTQHQPPLQNEYIYSQQILEPQQQQKQINQNKPLNLENFTDFNEPVPTESNFYWGQSNKNLLISKQQDPVHIFSRQRQQKQQPTKQTPVKNLGTLFLNKDSEEQIQQQKPSSKSWQEIFHASTNFQKYNHVVSEYQRSNEEVKVQPPPPQPPKDSPRKKLINIASLLKAKKKSSIKPDQN